MSAFEGNDVDFEGRNVNVEITTKQRTGQARSGGGGSRGGDSGRSPRRRTGDSDRGNDRKRAGDSDRKPKTDFSGFGRKRPAGAPGSVSKSTFGSDQNPKRRKRI